MQSPLALTHEKIVSAATARTTVSALVLTVSVVLVVLAVNINVLNTFTYSDSHSDRASRFGPKIGYENL